MTQSIGDLAMNFSNRASNVRIRTELNTLSQELSSGLKSDYRTPLSGDISPVATINRSLSNITAYGTLIRESETFLTGAQSALGQVTDLLQGLASSAFDMENTNNPALIANFGKQSANQFESLVGALNTTIAGRSIFSGTDTATQPIDDPAMILDDLMGALPIGATAADIAATVDAYFAPGAGFETARYLGSNTALNPFRLTDDDTIQFDVTALNDEILGALAATAKVALLDRGVLLGDTSEQGNLIRSAGLELVNAGAEVVALRGNVGILESRLETARARNATELDSLEMTRAALIGADPFETATRLQVVQTQLETFYTLTARLSRLNLTGFLR